MQGVDRHTGQSLGGLAHLRQSIVVLLTTRIGTRVMRRDYGCGLWQFIDAPMNPRTFAHMYSQIAIAIDLWEPRIELLSCQIEQGNNTQGIFVLSMKARLKKGLKPTQNLLIPSITKQRPISAANNSSQQIIINNTALQTSAVKNAVNQEPAYIGNGAWVLQDIPITGTVKAYINGQRVDIKSLQNNMMQVDFDFDPAEDVMRVDYQAPNEIQQPIDHYKKNEVIELNDLILN